MIAKFYLALSCVSVGQTDRAIENLETLNSDDNKYNQQISWYLILAYLKAGRREGGVSALGENYERRISVRTIEATAEGIRIMIEVILEN